MESRVTRVCCVPSWAGARRQRGPPGLEPLAGRRLWSLREGAGRFSAFVTNALTAAARSLGSGCLATPLLPSSNTGKRQPQGDDAQVVSQECRTAQRIQKEFWHHHKQNQTNSKSFHRSLHVDRNLDQLPSLDSSLVALVSRSREEDALHCLGQSGSDTHLPGIKCYLCPRLLRRVKSRRRPTASHGRPVEESPRRPA